MRVLVLFAHPRTSASVVQRRLFRAASGLEGVTPRDLYAAYPDFAIDAATEQRLLLEHDVVVFQHPFYWYSSPAILKEWQDIVLEHGWAYGAGGTKLYGKFLMTAISTGGAESAYQPEGRNRFSIGELLSPFNQTAHLCGMGYLEPFVLHEGRKLAGETLDAAVRDYRALLQGLAAGTIDPLRRIAGGYALPRAFAAEAR